VTPPFTLDGRPSGVAIDVAAALDNDWVFFTLSLINEQTGETRLRITLAVAGFSMDDLQITQEDNQLVIRGRQKDDSEGRIFLHRGIAARQFQRAFVLAEGIEVEGAWLDNGLLHVDLRRPLPEVRVKTIQISGRGNGVQRPLVNTGFPGGADEKQG